MAVLSDDSRFEKLLFFCITWPWELCYSSCQKTPGWGGGDFSGMCLPYFPHDQWVGCFFRSQPHRWHLSLDAVSPLLSPDAPEFFRIKHLLKST